MLGSVTRRRRVPWWRRRSVDGISGDQEAEAVVRPVGSTGGARRETGTTSAPALLFWHQPRLGSLLMCGNRGVCQSPLRWHIPVSVTAPRPPRPAPLTARVTRAVDIALTR